MKKTAFIGIWATALLAGAGVLGSVAPAGATARASDSTARFGVQCPSSSIVSGRSAIRADFGFKYQPKRRSAAAAVFLFDYGDGPHFSSESWPDANVSGLHHTYRNAGHYTFHAAVIDVKGRRHDAQCAWTWTPVAPARPSYSGGGDTWSGSSSGGGSTSGGRVGAICGDGTRSYATGQGACSWHRGVSYWLYG